MPLLSNHLLLFGFVSFLQTGAIVLPRKSDQICDKPGSDTNTDAYYYDDTGAQNTLAKCQQHCIADAQCSSLGYSGNICMHFDVPLIGNFEQDSHSATRYSDRSCFANNVSTTKSTKTTEKLTSTTTGKSTSASGTLNSATTPDKKSTISTTSTIKVDGTRTTTTNQINNTSATTTSKVGSSTAATTTKVSTTNMNGATKSSTTAASSTTKASSTSTGISTTTKLRTSDFNDGSKSSKTTSKLPTSSSQQATTSARATSSSTDSASTTSSTVTVPSGCSIPSAYTISNFYMFNSSHNLDCVRGPDLGDGTGCIDGNGAWCDPTTDPNCNQCGVNLCSTGLPDYQPLGYGPPDRVTLTFGDGSGCSQTNPQSVHRYEVGEGFVQCGGSYPFANFYGSSNNATNSGHVHLNGYMGSCADGRYITGQYDGYFDYPCTRDAQNNATCVYDKPVQIPLSSYTFS